MERFASAGKINLQKTFTGRRRVVVPAAEEWGCIRPSPGTQPRMGVKMQVCAAERIFPAAQPLGPSGRL